MTGEGSLFDVPPAAIGRFRVLHQVGAGTCGPVFRAVDPDGDRAVAIKLFTLKLAPERVGALVARLEALVADMPPLAAAVSPVAAGRHAETPFLVTTFASGDSLDVALKQFGPAALEDLVPRLRALAGALDAAAERGILHGALHPRDILVSEHDTAITGLGLWPLLVEFGVRLPARRPYRAPELTKAAVSAAGDQFALAALAYEWMTGRRVPALFGLSDMAPIPGADRDRMALVFARALNAAPDDRFPSCTEFVSAVAEVAADAEPPAPADETRPRTRPPAEAAGLPLDAFPAEVAPLDPTPSTRADDPATAPAPKEVETLAAPPAEDKGDRWGAAGVARGPEAAGPAVIYASPPLFASARYEDSGRASLGRLAVAVLVGLGLGVGAGYLIWGRTSSVDITANSAVPADAAAPPSAAPVPAPSTEPAPANPSPSDVVEPGRSAGERATSDPAPTPRVPGAAPASPTVAPPAATPPGAGERRADAAAPSGSLLIRSSPAGATVFVDDERKGLTPLALRDLALGTRRVRVQRDGYDAENRQVTLTRGRPSRSVDVRLRRAASAAPQGAAVPAPATSAARTGTLVIESRPSGATVLVNGRSVGTTPVTIEDLAPGSYSVQLQLSGYRTVTTTVRVVAGERARAAASLTGAQEPK